MRIFLVDAERSLHRGVQMRLDREADMTLVGEADTLSGALERLGEAKPDIVLIDPVGLATDPELVIADAHHAYPDVLLIVLSLHDDEDSRERALSAGAAAFVSKHEAAERLLQVIRRVGSQTSSSPEESAV